jgi:glutamate synthase (NADPH/NADH) small chain
MELGEPDESGRRRPVPIEGSEFLLEVDTVILALGYWPDPLISETTPGLETHDWGLITVSDDTCVTSRENIFAGGDDVVGADLVVTAVAHGRTAAESMHAYMMGRSDHP